MEPRDCIVRRPTVSIHWKATSKRSLLARTPETPAGSERTAWTATETSGTWETHGGPVRSRAGRRDRGTSKEAPMPPWESDSLRVLGAWESHVQGEATSAMFSGQGDMCPTQRGRPHDNRIDQSRREGKSRPETPVHLLGPFAHPAILGGDVANGEQEGRTRRGRRDRRAVRE
jgi:hypothetical protein